MSNPRASIDKRLLANLPRTFVPVFNQQLREWNLLFPAEHRQVNSTLKYLSGLTDAELRQLFAPIHQLEAEMSLSQWWDVRKKNLAVNDVSVLARSRHYPQWRAEVEKIVAQINLHVENAGQQQTSNKMIMCVLPAGLPLNTGLFRSTLTRQGRWVQLRQPLGEILNEFVTSLAQREIWPDTEPIEQTWVLECEPRIARNIESTTVTVLCYELLAAARREFRKHLNSIDKDLRSVDEAYTELRSLGLGRLLESAWGEEPRVREFVRNLFLSGNGAVVFNNSFVQWGASEALRRAQPQVLVCHFGIRQKLKPFSSLVLFEDQNRANPVPAQDDPDGSLIDIQILCEYVRLMAEGLPAYRNRTVYLFGAADLDVLLLLDLPGFFDVPAGPAHELSFSQLNNAALRWLAHTP